jgi:outer membrane protein TolC
MKMDFRIGLLACLPAAVLTGQSAPDHDRVPAVDEWIFDTSVKDALLRHIADPALEAAEVRARLSGGEDLSKIDRKYSERLIDKLTSIRRDRQVTLSLDEAIRRALEHNFALKVERYNPAIQTTRIVEAEAAFDATFFMSMSDDSQDRPSGSQLVGTEIDTFQMSAGVTKRLANGMVATASLSLRRSSNNFAFQQLNPEYFTQGILEFRQPFLRDFGVDVNRFEININKTDRRISDQQFRRQVRQLLRDVEEAYWRLIQSRREVTIAAIQLNDFELIYDYLDQRREFDVYPIQLADTLARLETSRAEFIQSRANVYNRQDALVALMNSPDLNLADLIEIVPVEKLTPQRKQMERLEQVKTAFERRAEIEEAKLNIERARLNVGFSKNQALPRFDVTFRASVDGLAGNADKSFDEFTRNNFHEYFVQLEYEIPIGNRARRAAYRRAELHFAQAAEALRAQYEQIALDVNVTFREMTTALEQVIPTLKAADASADQIDAIVARAERKDFLTLNNELGARQTLAANRQRLVASLVRYKVAIMELERAKGTLLEYNNVEIESPWSQGFPIVNDLAGDHSR